MTFSDPTDAFSSNPDSAPAADSLPAALARYEVSLPEEQIAQIAAYCRSLWSWNERLNLTRHTTYDKFVSRDVIDAVHLERLLEPGERVLDVGTGGGLPGALLAILRPDLHVELCDSVGKKARAVQEIMREAGLDLKVHAVAGQSMVADGRFDTLVIRAVAPLAKLLTWFAPHWGEFKRLLIIKGPAWVEERGEARHRGLMRSLALRKLDSYPLIGTESESVILGIQLKQGAAEEED